MIPPFTRGDLDLTEALKFDKTELGRRIATLRGYAKAAGRSPDSIELSGNSFVLAARDKSAVEGDGAGDRDRDGGKAELEGDEVLKAIFSYVASDEAAHAGFYRKMVKIELGADREATVSDFAYVLANFKMPGDGLIPHYQERLRTGGGGIARAVVHGRGGSANFAHPRHHAGGDRIGARTAGVAGGEHYQQFNLTHPK